MQTLHFISEERTLIDFSKLTFFEKMKLCVKVLLGGVYVMYSKHTTKKSKDGTN